MKPEEFNQMWYSKKSETVFNSACCITCTRYAGYKIVVYALYDFFVEMYVDLQRESVHLIKAIDKEEFNSEGIHHLPGLKMRAFACRQTPGRVA